jgi:hypothetical protein
MKKKTQIQTKTVIAVSQLNLLQKSIVLIQGLGVISSRYVVNIVNELTRLIKILIKKVNTKMKKLLRCLLQQIQKIEYLEV